jgi:hypothetical protein
MDRAETVFATPDPIVIPSETLCAVELRPDGSVSAHLESVTGAGVRFRTRGWYEVLLRVEWDAVNTDGTRFSHTKIPAQEPLLSEAINADVLTQLSDGKQLLRGNSLFGPGWADELSLEVWQNSNREIIIHQAVLTVRSLAVPWPAVSTAP